LQINFFKKMAKPGTVILVEDDIDDKRFFEDTLKEIGLNYDIAWFETTYDALEFLRTTKKPIFLIFSDINLPGKNGLEFKRTIDEDPKLRKKSIPFVFYSTSAYQQDVNEAYTKMTVQGFFKKGNDLTETAHTLKLIFDYWTLCKHPNAR